MAKRMRFLAVLLAGGTAVVFLLLAAPGRAVVRLAIARIIIEYNSSGNDLGFHVFLDGEDWKSLRIVNPGGATIFEVAGKGPYAKLGLTELFFEGAEPSLDDVPLEDLLALFPEGRYRFFGKTVDGEDVIGTAILSHAIPAGPTNLRATRDDDDIVIRWDAVTSPPEDFPEEDIKVVGYQIIVGSFQVTLPASFTRVTLPEELVESLAPGEHDFEVLAIDASGNQTITEGTFETD